MLDVLGILISGLAMLFVIFRAVQLDHTRPWFEAAPALDPAKAAAETPKPEPIRPVHIRRRK